MKYLIPLTLDNGYKLLRMRHRIKIGFWIILLLGLVGLSFLGVFSLPAAAQADATPTQTPAPSDRFITVTYIEPINVRSGPGTFDYPVIGTLPVGGTAPAIGRSPAGEWIEILFPGGPGGVGWVYAPNVELSPGPYLPIVEPPPTATPLMTPTLNPTFVAAFQTVASPTRLPTFTAPPPLTLPTYANSPGVLSGGIRIGWVIFGLGLLGLLGIVVSIFSRRR